MARYADEADNRQEAPDWPSSGGTLGMQASAAVPGSELRDVVTRQAKARREQANEAMQGGPEGWPELARELTMQRGALSGVQRRVAELIAAIQPVMCRTVEELVSSDRAVPEKPAPEVSTDVARIVREITDELGELENLVGAAANALRL